jgi:hypothetical protein
MMNRLDQLPPEAILTDREVCELVGISVDTLWRLERRGDAPPRVQLSARRHGRRLGVTLEQAETDDAATYHQTTLKP